jgi:hypothetical protein
MIPSAFVLDADGSNVRLRQVGVAQSSLTEMSLDGTPGRMTARLRGAGSDYSATLRLDGAITQ